MGTQIGFRTYGILWDIENFVHAKQPKPPDIYALNELAYAMHFAGVLRGCLPCPHNQLVYAQSFLSPCLIHLMLEAGFDVHLTHHRQKNAADKKMNRHMRLVFEGKRPAAPSLMLVASGDRDIDPIVCRLKATNHEVWIIGSKPAFSQSVRSQADAFFVADELLYFWEINKKRALPYITAVTKALRGFYQESPIKTLGFATRNPKRYQCSTTA